MNISNHFPDAVEEMNGCFNGTALGMLDPTCVEHVMLRRVASNLEAMASNLKAMASNLILIAMASNLEAMASNLEAMASNLIAMASNLEAMTSNLIAPEPVMYSVCKCLQSQAGLKLPLLSIQIMAQPLCAGSDFTNGFSRKTPKRTYVYIYRIIPARDPKQCVCEVYKQKV